MSIRHQQKDMAAGLVDIHDKPIDPRGDTTGRAPAIEEPEGGVEVPSLGPGPDSVKRRATTL